MNRHVSAHHGAKLLKADRRHSHGKRWLTACLACVPQAVLQRKLSGLDAGLAHGTLQARLPDGSLRILGGRGDGPTAIVELKSWAALVRLALFGSIGWYQGWEAGEWTADDPVRLFELFAMNAAEVGKETRPRGLMRWVHVVRRNRRRNNRRGARCNVHAHYDIGNEFYGLWIDEKWNYSSALYIDLSATLEVSQQAKVDEILDRLDLHSQARLLEIGCGWGALAERAIERFALNYVGITLSTEQRAMAGARLDQMTGTPRSQIFLKDYRDMTGAFDAIASVEMVEAVGQKYWPDYVAAIARLLRPGGKAAVQYISIRDDLFEAYAANRDFIQAYIFPGGCLISESRFRALAEAQGLAWLDHRHFGFDYARTLREWRRRFDAAVAGGRLPQGLDDRFVRLWRYYLQYCEGGFRGGSINVAQVTLVKNAI